jgi:hypothetical protein
MSAAPLAEAPPADAEQVKEPEEQVIRLELQLFEGYRPVEATLNFVGNIAITSPEVAQALKLGREVELIIRGEVRSRGHKKTGEGKDAIASSTILVSSVELYED